MIKKFLLTTLLCAAALGASAATETFTYSYANQPCTLGAYGYNSLPQMYGAAMGFYAPAYAGMKITRIDAYLNMDESSYKNISDTRVFMTDKLELEVPSIVNAAVSPVLATWKNKPQFGPASDETVSVLSYELPEPYVIDANPIYIGYKLKVDKVVGEGEKHPILLDKDVVNSDGSFFYYDQGSTNGEWMDAYTNGAAVIVVTIEREVYDYALATIMPDDQYAEVSKDFEVLLTVQNNGKNAINSLSYKYSLNGGAYIEKTLTLEESLAPSLDKSYALLLPFDPVEEIGDYAVDIEITEVNGMPNESDAAATYFILSVLPYKAKNVPLVEEFTALNCGYCPRGYAAMEYLSNTYPDDVVVICYHNDAQGVDPMTVTNTMPVPPADGVQSNPTAGLNRTGIIDPYYGDWQRYGSRPLGIVEDVFRVAAQPTIVDIQIKEVSFNAVDSVINVTTEVTFLKSVADDAYRLGYVLTCDGLWDQSWAQTNYLSRDNSIKDLPLLDEFYSLPAKVYDLTFNDVAINVEAYKGISNSLTGVTVGTPIVNNYSFNVKHIRNTSGRSMLPWLAVDRMRVNAFVIDRSTTYVVNATKFDVGNVYNEVKGIEAAEDDANAVYYDLQGRRVANPDRGIYVKVVNGRSQKVVK